MQFIPTDTDVETDTDYSGNISIAESPRSFSASTQHYEALLGARRPELVEDTASRGILCQSPPEVVLSASASSSFEERRGGPIESSLPTVPLHPVVSVPYATAVSSAVNTEENAAPPPVEPVVVHSKPAAGVARPKQPPRDRATFTEIVEGIGWSDDIYRDSNPAPAADLPPPLLSSSPASPRPPAPAASSSSSSIVPQTKSFFTRRNPFRRSGSGSLEMNPSRRAEDVTCPRLKTAATLYIHPPCANLRPQRQVKPTVSRTFVYCPPSVVDLCCAPARRAVVPRLTRRRPRRKLSKAAPRAKSAARTKPATTTKPRPPKVSRADHALVELGDAIENLGRKMDTLKLLAASDTAADLVQRQTERYKQLRQQLCDLEQDLERQHARLERQIRRIKVPCPDLPLVSTPRPSSRPLGDDLPRVEPPPPPPAPAIIARPPPTLAVPPIIAVSYVDNRSGAVKTEELAFRSSRQLANFLVTLNQTARQGFSPRPSPRRSPTKAEESRRRLPPSCDTIPETSSTDHSEQVFVSRFPDCWCRQAEPLSTPSLCSEISSQPSLRQLTSCRSPTGSSAASSSPDAAMLEDVFRLRDLLQGSSLVNVSLERYGPEDRQFIQRMMQKLCEKLGRPNGQRFLAKLKREIEERRRPTTADLLSRLRESTATLPHEPRMSSPCRPWRKRRLQQQQLYTSSAAAAQQQRQTAATPHH